MSWLSMPNSPSEPQSIAAVQATERHLEQIRVLAREARSGLANHKGGESLRAELPETIGGTSGLPDSDLSLIAGLVGDDVLGYGVLRIRDSRAELREIYVTPEARCVGVGTRILETAKELAAVAHCVTLDSFALPGDRHTKNFFEEHDMVTRKLVVQTRL